jgi:hypothetical protein
MWNFRGKLSQNLPLNANFRENVRFRKMCVRQLGAKTKNFAKRNFAKICSFLLHFRFSWKLKNLFVSTLTLLSFKWHFHEKIGLLYIGLIGSFATKITFIFRESVILFHEISQTEYHKIPQKMSPKILVTFEMKLDKKIQKVQENTRGHAKIGQLLRSGSRFNFQIKSDNTKKCNWY